METIRSTLKIINGKIVMPECIREGEAILIEEGLITRIGLVPEQSGARLIDAQGAYILPGIIDLHSDALEKEMEPRPNTLFPTDMVLLEMDKKLAACGITTMYHSISFAEGEIGIRSNSMADSIIREINRLSSSLWVRTKVHARYEMTDEAAIPILEMLITHNMVHLLSFMNHTPGQGQFKDADAFHRYYSIVYQKTEAEIRRTIIKKVAAMESIWDRADHLISLCGKWHIPMASHDDDSEEKVRWVMQRGITISEFPVTLDAALAASRNRLHVCLGAPNALRGRSQANNLSAREALARGAGHVLCSDYAPMTLLHGVFRLFESGLMSLPDAVRLVTLNPAKAVGIDAETGSLQEGKVADLSIVNKINGLPQVLKTLVNGQEVFSTCLK
jgi:alpha-D-ribose 1-methylphosphonate 5-triphosphate diphosphatase